jgi:hypothetical protein
MHHPQFSISLDAFCLFSSKFNYEFLLYLVFSFTIRGCSSLVSRDVHACIFPALVKDTYL